MRATFPGGSSVLVGALTLGAASCIPSAIAEALPVQWTGVVWTPSGAEQMIRFVAFQLMVGPIEEAAKLGALLLLFHLVPVARHATAGQKVALALTVALGSHGLEALGNVLTARGPVAALSTAAVSSFLLIPTMMALAAIWGTAVANGRRVAASCALAGLGHTLSNVLAQADQLVSWSCPIPCQLVVVITSRTLFLAVVTLVMWSALRSAWRALAGRCSACGGQVLPGSRYCGDCGARVALPCASCGAELEPFARFCHLCGRQMDDLRADARWVPLGSMSKGGNHGAQNDDLQLVWHDADADACMRQLWGAPPGGELGLPTPAGAGRELSGGKDAD